MHKTASVLREKRKLKQEEEKKKINELLTNNKEQYLANLYDRRQVIIERISDRQKQKEEITKRGSKTAQRRMQMIAELGIDENDKRQKRERGIIIEKEREDGNDDFVDEELQTLEIDKQNIFKNL